jgi:hypothetical protein
MVPGLGSPRRRESRLAFVPEVADEKATEPKGQRQATRGVARGRRYHGLDVRPRCVLSRPGSLIIGHQSAEGDLAFRINSPSEKP